MICAEPNLTLHGSVTGIARGCTVPWGHQEESLVSTPLVKPCCSTAHWDPIEMLEGGYGHSIGPGCVPGVPLRASHRGPCGLRDCPRGPKFRMFGNKSIGTLSGTILPRPSPIFYEMGDSISGELQWFTNLFCNSNGAVTRISTNLEASGTMST